MREIKAHQITQAICEMCIEANCIIPPDIKHAMEKAQGDARIGLNKKVITTLLDNYALAQKMMLPICQDTGMAVIFVEVGQEVQVVGGDFTQAVNAGVAKGYQSGFLRKSVVADPIRRENTQNNTPAVIHWQIVPGDQLKLTVAPKGFGSENMSALKMLTPSAGLPGVKNFIVDTVKQAGPNPCPPIIVGVGVGGTMEKAALLAKESLLRPLGIPNPDNFWQEIEEDLLKEINSLGIGPAGFGGSPTALAVHINPWPTHIAGLPVVVNMSCHVTRHVQRII